MKKFKKSKKEINKAKMATKILFYGLLIMLGILILPSAHAEILNASIVNVDNNQPVNMSYESSTMKAYVDKAAGNPDVTLLVCIYGKTPVPHPRSLQNFISTEYSNLTGYYGGFVYKVGNYSAFQPIAATSTSNLSAFSEIDESNCFKTEDTLNFLSDYAVYPAYVYAVISDDQNIDSGDTFFLIDQTSWLVGRYGFNGKSIGDISGVQLSYNQDTGNVSVNVTKIEGCTNVSAGCPTNVTITVNKPYLFVAICDLNASSYVGYDCYGANQTSPGILNSLFTGVTGPSDNDIIIKYLVVNGIPHPFCIGPDLSVTGLSILPNPTYQSQIVTLNATVKNANNVNVSHAFNVSFWKDYSEFLGNVTIASLGAGQSTNAILNVNTIGWHSGLYNITAKVEDSNFGDCNDGNDNFTAQLQIMKTYNVTILINGTATKTFPRPGRPYNVSVFVQDSDGNTNLQNLTLKIVEKNGMSLFAPVQSYTENSEKKGVISYSIAEVRTNSSGATSFTLIPTGNKLYSSEYSYLNISDYVGNYSLYLELFNGSQKLQLYDPATGSLVDRINLSLSSHTVLDPSDAERNSIEVYNHDSVRKIIELFVQVFGNVQKWIKG